MPRPRLPPPPTPMGVIQPGANRGKQGPAVPGKVRRQRRVGQVVLGLRELGRPLTQWGKEALSPDRGRGPGHTRCRLTALCSQECSERHV